MGLFDFVSNYIARPISEAITGVHFTDQQYAAIQAVAPKPFLAPVAELALNFVPGGSTIQAFTNTAPSTTPSREV